MKRHLRQLWVIAVLAAPALANHPAKSVGAEERARIDAASAPALGSMRAGRDQDPKTMLSSERSALRSLLSMRYLGDLILRRPRSGRLEGPP